MRMRRNIVGIFLTLITLTLINHSCASEEWTEFILGEVGITISLPNDYDVFIRDMPNDSKILLNYELTPEEVNELLSSGNGFLDAYSYNGTKEILVTMVESSISNFSIWEDYTLYTLASSWGEVYEKSGVMIDKYDIYHSGSITYIRLWEHIVNDPGLYGLQYHTTYDHQAINITLIVTNSEITAEDEAFMLEMINRTVFNKSQESIPVNKEEKSFETDERTRYTDQESGTSFLLPSGWHQKKYQKNGKLLTPNSCQKPAAGHV